MLKRHFPLGDPSPRLTAWFLNRVRSIGRTHCDGITRPINCSVVSFLSGLGRRIAEVSGETRDGSFQFQRLSVLIQRFNAVLLHDCFVDEVAGDSS